jgi:lipopolysaccharide export LptBFGC system permease protein LptF
VNLRSLIFAAVVAAALWAPAAASAKDQTQQFFEQKLLADKRTSKTIKELLQSGGGFVDKKVVFRDVTGDKRDDAIVRVNSGGANGAIAVYVFSTANKKGGKLRVIFRSQSLMRVSTRVSKGVVSYRTARYEPGDELCCPAHVTESTLGWDKADRRMKVVKRETFAPPPEAQAPAAPPPPEDPN